MKVWEQYTPELVTDLYELTMAESYLREGMSGEATFSLFIREYPENRSYFVAAGIEHLLEILPDLRFSEESLSYLTSLGKFSDDFIAYLRGFRFSGNIRAIPEGRVFFADEPILEVSGPVIEAQVIETLVMNVVQLETMLASKASRVFGAACGKGLIDFGMRRAHGVDASVKAARAAYMTGFLGTSNLLAGKIYGIPVYGTMAHSYVTSFECELEAFHAFGRAFPDNTVLLIDTYDTLSGAYKAVQAARSLRDRGKELLAVRLDSGDLAELSKGVRRILDEAGLSDVKIMASGALDEFRIEALINEKAQIDFFAVGTRMGVSADAPSLDIAYKLVEYDSRPIMKLSSGKKTLVGKKQIYRHYGPDGRMDHDHICLLDSDEEGGESLLRLEMQGGMPVREPESLMDARRRFVSDWQRLPEKYKALRRPDEPYPVRISRSLQELDSITARKKRAEEVGIPA